jgi:hypothetical protein
MCINYCEHKYDDTGHVEVNDARWLNFNARGDNLVRIK